MTAIFGTANMPFETETEARSFLLMEGFIQIHVPRGRVFMHALRPTTVEIAQVTADGWAIRHTDLPQRRNQDRPNDPNPLPRMSGRPQPLPAWARTDPAML